MKTGAAFVVGGNGDDMSAFGPPERLASWAGVLPGNNESAEEENRQNPQR